MLRRKKKEMEKPPIKDFDKEIKKFYDIPTPKPKPIMEHWTTDKNGFLVPKSQKLDAGAFDMGTKVAREHFFKNHVLLPDGHRRFVSWRDLKIAHDILKEAKKMPNDDGYGFTVTEDYKTNTKLWIPNGYDEDFNLITSLTTNGLHYGLYDIDLPKESVKFQPNIGLMHVQWEGEQRIIKFNGPIVIYNSTKNCHVYETKPSLLSEYYERLASIPGDDAKKYRHNVESKGYGTLRVPWVKKSSEEQETG